VRARWKDQGVHSRAPRGVRAADTGGGSSTACPGGVQAQHRDRHIHRPSQFSVRHALAHNQSQRRQMASAGARPARPTGQALSRMGIRDRRRQSSRCSQAETNTVVPFTWLGDTNRTTRGSGGAFTSLAIFGGRQCMSQDSYSHMRPGAQRTRAAIRKPRVRRTAQGQALQARAQRSQAEVTRRGAGNASRRSGGQVARRVVRVTTRQVVWGIAAEGGIRWRRQSRQGLAAVLTGGPHARAGCGSSCGTSAGQ
jgi:hypothetical protein